VHIHVIILQFFPIFRFLMQYSRNLQDFGFPFIPHRIMPLFFAVKEKKTENGGKK